MSRTRFHIPVIVGSIRSGTTLMRTMLDSHPLVAVPYESYFPLMLLARRSHYEGPGGIRENRLVSDLFHDRRLSRYIVGHWGLSEHEVRAQFHLGKLHTVPDVVRTLYRIYAAKQGKMHCGDKSPMYALWIPLLARSLPEARFLHLIRDGREVAASVLDRKARGWPKGPLATAYMWSRTVNSGRAAGEALGSKRYMEVRYTDLVSDSELILINVCRFLDLEYSPAMLEYGERALASIPAGDRWQHPNLSRPPVANLRSWTELGPEQLTRFESLAKVTLERSGYRTVTSPGPLLKGRARLYRSFRAALEEEGYIGRARIVLGWYRELFRKKFRLVRAHEELSES